MSSSRATSAALSSAPVSSDSICRRNGCAVARSSLMRPSSKDMLGSMPLRLANRQAFLWRSPRGHSRTLRSRDAIPACGSGEASGLAVREMHHAAVVGLGLREAQPRNGLVGEEPLPHAEDDGEDEQVQAIDETVLQEGSHECPAAADVERPLDLIAQATDDVRVVGPDDAG